MLKRLGYYAIFAVLVVVFGLSGFSDLLSSKLVFIISGTIIAISLAIALWLTTSRKSLQTIETKGFNINQSNVTKTYYQKHTAKHKTVKTKKNGKIALKKRGNSK